MRLSTALLLTIISTPTLGQQLAGKYVAYYGNKLELKEDSTFRYEWNFDLASSWSVGKWRVSNKTIYLNIMPIYDTLTREGRPDTLVLSSDERSNRINNDELTSGSLSGGGQGRRIDRITSGLAIKGKRLYPLNADGKILRGRVEGIWNKKKKPTYYFRTG